MSLVNRDTKESQKIPFSLVNNSFQVAIENLMAGNYDYKVSVEGQNINKYGRFLITDYNIEEQFTSANLKKLQTLADKTGGEYYFSNQINTTIDDLVANKNYVTTQKSILKEQSLIDWKWILFLILVLLSVEWFTRKYFGKI